MGGAMRRIGGLRRLLETLAYRVEDVAEGYDLWRCFFDGKGFADEDNGIAWGKDLISSATGTE